MEILFRFMIFNLQRVQKYSGSKTDIKTFLKRNTNNLKKFNWNLFMRIVSQCQTILRQKL